MIAAARSLRCERCGTELLRRALVRVPLAAWHVDGGPVTLLDAPDEDGNATMLVCRSSRMCRRRQRKGGR